MREVPAADDGAQAPDAPERVVPLESAALRLMSVWAAEMLNEELVFSYDAAPNASPPRLRRVPPLSDPRPGEVRIPARTAARPQRVASLRVQVNTLWGEVLGADYGAAFWSEPAVEKFLTPYLAALGGAAADVVLTALATVWNGYPDDKPVFAMLHRARRPELASLDLDQLLDVWYLDREANELRVSSVGDFLPFCTYRPLPAPTVELPYQRGDLQAPEPLLPREYLLRRLGEWTSALRGTPLYLLYDVVKGRARQVRTLPEVLTNQVVIPVHTRTTGLHRPRPSSVLLHPNDGLPADLGRSGADAAFWSTGTVSKVMIPYYAVAYGGTGLGVMSRIYQIWNEFQALTESDAEVYGLIHLPKSDWGYETVEPASSVGAVFAPSASAGAEPQVTSFTEFLHRWGYR